MTDSEITYLISFILAIPPIIATFVILVEVWFDS